MKYLLRLGRLLVLVYVGLIVFLAGCQNRLLYVPSRGEEAALVKEADAEGLKPWRSADGKVIGWQMTKPNAKRRLVIFHGNAGNALHRSYYAEAFSRHGFDVYLFEYPGYGARDGSPGRKAFLDAGRMAVESLLAADQRPFYLLGESIGSGTACALAAEFPDKVDGMVLMIPFARLAEVAKWHFPYLPVGLLLRDRYDNIASLEKYHRPVAFVIAECDEVVSPEQGRKLHESYTGPKKLIVMPTCGHNDFPNHPGADWLREATAFLDAPR